MIGGGGVRWHINFIDDPTSHVAVLGVVILNENGGDNAHDNKKKPLQLGVDESYTITIPSDGSAITIIATTVYGAYWALETLSQLIWWDYEI